MQLFLRNLGKRTTVVEVEKDDDIATLRSFIAAQEGVSPQDQVLVCGSQLLQDDSLTLQQAGVVNHSTLHLSRRLRGGKPVKVKMMTSHLPCGPEVTIDIETNATKDEIKQKLAAATGVPMEHQKVMLSGINQIMMGDKRTNIGYSACGSTNGVQMAVGIDPK